MDYTNLYYKYERQDLAGHLSAGKHRILDVGCAEGLLGESLKQKGLASEVIGIELNSDAAKVAETRLDRVVCGDIETIDKEKLNLEPESFDYIICGDVLEHLRDPWKIIKWLATLLKRNGHMVVSIPNVRHWNILYSLVFRGEWEYQDQGIMDRTHLRFFTKKSAMQLLAGCGLKVEVCEGSKLSGKKNRLVSGLLLGMGKDFTSMQWILVGKRI